MTNKTRENLLRRMARRQGLKLTKSYTRDPLALDYGLYALTEIGADPVPHTMTLEQVEQHLFKKVKK